jgi:hypothetical protein
VRRPDAAGFNVASEANLHLEPDMQCRLGPAARAFPWVPNPGRIAGAAFFVTKRIADPTSRPLASELVSLRTDAHRHEPSLASPHR